MQEAINERMKAKARQRVDMLKSRAGRCVCKYCGGKLSLKQITFSPCDEARIEIFCQDCNRLEFGVEPEIFASARYFVQESGFNCYPDLDDSFKTRRMSIAKVCEILTWQNQNIGILTPEGYQIPIHMTERFLGECTTFSEADLRQDEPNQ